MTADHEKMQGRLPWGSRRPLDCNPLRRVLHEIESATCGSHLALPMVGLTNKKQAGEGNGVRICTGPRERLERLEKRVLLGHPTSHHPRRGILVPLIPRRQPRYSFGNLLEHVLRRISPEDDRLEHLLVGSIQRINLLGLIGFLSQRLQ